MNVHCVGFILASAAEIRDGSAFRESGRFCAWDATVVIRCEQDGRDLQVHCPADEPSWCARKIQIAWEEKHGPST